MIKIKNNAKVKISTKKRTPEKEIGTIEKCKRMMEQGNLQKNMLIVMINIQRSDRMINKIAILQVKDKEMHLLECPGGEKIDQIHKRITKETDINITKIIRRTSEADLNPIIEETEEDIRPILDLPLTGPVGLGTTIFRLPDRHPEIDKESTPLRYKDLILEITKEVAEIVGDQEVREIEEEILPEAIAIRERTEEELQEAVAIQEITREEILIKIEEMRKNQVIKEITIIQTKKGDQPNRL